MSATTLYYQMCNMRLSGFPEGHPNLYDVTTYQVRERLVKGSNFRYGKPKNISSSVIMHNVVKGHCYQYVDTVN
jgi:hypothetical protein